MRDNEFIAVEDRQPLDDMRAGGARAETGFEVLYRRYYARLWRELKCGRRFQRYHLHNSPELIEDICSETFFEFYQGIDIFEERCSVYTWLHSLAHNRLRAYFRNKGTKQQQRENDASQTDGHDFVYDDVVSLQDIERDICFAQCMEKMLEKIKDGPDSDCYRALTLQVLKASIEEVAKELGRTLGATKVFLSTTCKKKVADGAVEKCVKECLDEK